MSLPRPCQEFRALIPDRLSGDLSLAQNELFEAHLRGCAGCRSEVEKYKNLLGVMRSHYGSLKPTTSRPKVPAEVSAPSTGWALPEWLAPWFSPFRLAGVAAGVAVLVLLFSRLVLSPIGYSPLETPRSVRGGEAMAALTSGVLRVADGAPAGSAGLLLNEEKIYLVQEKAQVTFAFGPVVTLQPSSRFSISSNTVSLETGRIHCLVRGASAIGFRIVTPTATLAVRGTEFEVVAGPEGTLCRLLEGRVRLESGTSAVELNPGQSALVLKDEAPLVLASERLGPSAADAGEVTIDASFWRKQAERWRKIAMPAPRPAVASQPVGVSPSVEVTPSVPGVKTASRSAPVPVPPEPASEALPQPAPVSEASPTDHGTPVPPMGETLLNHDPLPATPAIHVDGFPKAP